MMPDASLAETKVLQALENPEYVWRTLAGLKRETGLPAPEIAATLKRLPEDDLVTSRDRKGKRVFSTRKHYRQTQSIAGKLLSILSGRAK